MNRRYAVGFHWCIMVISVFLFRCTRPADLPDLDAYLKFKLERDHIPGMAVAVVSGDRMVWARGYGLANLDRQTPVTPSTVFGTASITKSLTAAAIFQLEEAGLLNPEDPVNDYLPFKVQSSWHPEAVLTIEQVLSHTSGISNGPSLWRIVGCGDSDISLMEWAEGYFTPGGSFWHPEGNFERWPPERGFQYSNAGYGLLAVIIETVSGMPYSDYIKTRILEPLEMHESSTRVARLDPSLLTQMYEWGDLWGFEYELIDADTDTADLKGNPRYTPICAYNDPIYGAGSLYSSVRELSNFLIMIRNRGVFKGKRILSKRAVDAMFSAKVDREFLPPWFTDLGMGAYGMPLSNGVPVWGHTGADPGMSSLMFFERETDLGIVVLCNRFFDIRDLIAYIYAEAVPAFSASPETLSPAWSAYTGIRNGKKRPVRQVTIRVFPDTLPESGAVWVIGNHPRLGGWISKGMPLNPASAGIRERTFDFFDSTRLEFKLTRGSWETQETLPNGQVAPNHSHLVTADTTLIFHVAGWQDTVQKGTMGVQ